MLAAAVADWRVTWISANGNCKARDPQVRTGDYHNPVRWGQTRLQMTTFGGSTRAACQIKEQQVTGNLSQAAQPTTQGLPPPTLRRRVSQQDIDQ